MDPQRLIRDPQRIHACLQELPDGSVVALKPVKIYIPTRFNERDLAEVGLETYIVGIYAMTCDDAFYAVSLVNAMIKIQPTATNIVPFNGVSYYEFVFEVGATVYVRTELVKNDTVVYYIYDELVSKGRVPWYLGYLEMCRLFETATEFAGANIGKEHEVTELLASILARNPKVTQQYYRRVLTEPDAAGKYIPLQNARPRWVSLRSIQHGPTNTLDRLAGAYFHEGVVTALNNPSDRVEHIESLLIS